MAYACFPALDADCMFLRSVWYWEHVFWGVKFIKYQTQEQWGEDSLIKKHHSYECKCEKESLYGPSIIGPVLYQLRKLTHKPSPSWQDYGLLQLAW